MQISAGGGETPAWAGPGEAAPSVLEAAGELRPNPAAESWRLLGAVPRLLLAPSV